MTPSPPTSPPPLSISCASAALQVLVPTLASSAAGRAAGPEGGRGSLWEFRKNFDAFCGGMLKGLDWTGVLAAGGQRPPQPPPSEAEGLVQVRGSEVASRGRKRCVLGMGTGGSQGRSSQRVALKRREP